MKNLLGTLLLVFVLVPSALSGPILEKIDANIELAKLIKNHVEVMKKILQTTPAATEDERKVFVKLALKSAKKNAKNVKKIQKKHEKLKKKLLELKVDFSRDLDEADEAVWKIGDYCGEGFGQIPGFKEEGFMKWVEESARSYGKCHGRAGDYINYMSRIRKKIAGSNSRQI